MKSHDVISGDGTHIQVVETGNPAGRPILFIHGISQCRLSWDRQLNSDLANYFRLAAMDLRGHGLSDRPGQETYLDSKLWADDVDAVIRSLDLDHPVLVGWSYGPLVILDYIRYYGEDNIAGVNFVGGITKLGSEEAMSVLGPEFLGIVPGLLSDDAGTSTQSLEYLVRMCFSDELQPDDLAMMLEFNVSVPPYVRQGMFSRSMDNDDLLPLIKKPVLITYGDLDKIVLPAAADQIKTAIPHAQLHKMENADHAPFWNDAANYNVALRRFAESL